MSPEPAKLLTREEVAHREIGHTRISRALAVTLTGVFLATLAGVPLAQLVHDVAVHPAQGREEGWPQAFDVFLAVPHAVDVARDSPRGPLGRILDTGNAMADELQSYQRTLKWQSVLNTALVPYANTVLTEWLGAGGEEVYVGRSGWLFYKPDADHAAGPGFLDEGWLARRRRAGVQPDPRPAILDFGRQLRARGIALVVMPTPGKPTIQPDALSAAYGSGAPLAQNPSFAAFKADLVREGVLVLDVSEALRQARLQTGQPQYLRTDTHWRPEAVERAAGLLGAFLAQRVPLPPAAPVAYRSGPVEVTAQGDLAVMLRLAMDSPAFGAESVTVHEVLMPDGAPWRASRAADVLVLGDSMSNIYSGEWMGWGDAAGLVEHLALAMRRPVDAILRNGAGARATRELLGRELARGRDRLAGKRVVVWQFADRELSIGDWRPVDLHLGRPPAAGAFVPPRGSAVVVTGTVAAVSAVPRPGRTPYRNHIMAVHLTDVAVRKGGEVQDAFVYLWSMRDRVLTPAAGYRPGDEVTLRLLPWSDVAELHGGINRSELAGDELYLQEPCWGEPVNP